MNGSSTPPLEAGSWKLRIPFDLSSGRRLPVPSDGITGRVAGKTYTIKRHEPDSYTIFIEGFDSEEAAEKFFANASAGLFLASIEHETAVLFRPNLRPVVYADDPERAAENLGFPGEAADGIISADEPAVFRTDKRVFAMAVSSPSVTVGISAERFAAAFVFGAEHDDAPHIQMDERLRTAMDLYAAHFAERSGAAKLLTLVMALEVLSVPVLKSPKAMEIVERWQEQIDHEIARTPSDRVEDLESLGALKRELLFRREVSLRQRVRRSVQNTLEAVAHPDAGVLARAALEVYDARSRLSHEGRLDHADLGVALRDAKVVVSTVLRARLVQSGESVV